MSGTEMTRRASGAGAAGAGAQPAPGRWAVVKALLRVQLIMAWRGFTQRRGRSKVAFLLAPLALLGFAPLIAMLSSAAFGFYLAGSAMGQGEVVLTFAFTAGQALALSFGVLYVLSTFFFARDLRLLTPLPLRAGD
ncbi:MAG: hypothetical protein M1602_01965, partial [Firmicutes bacterium]|nr:hypothetical protein [Bacillota bacterium]